MKYDTNRKYWIKLKLCCKLSWNIIQLSLFSVFSKTRDVVKKWHILTRLYFLCTICVAIMVHSLFSHLQIRVSPEQSTHIIEHLLAAKLGVFLRVQLFILWEDLKEYFFLKEPYARLLSMKISGTLYWKITRRLSCDAFNWVYLIEYNIDPTL